MWYNPSCARITLEFGARKDGAVTRAASGDSGEEDSEMIRSSDKLARTEVPLSDLSPDADGRGMSRRLQDEWKKM